MLPPSLSVVPELAGTAAYMIFAVLANIVFPLSEFVLALYKKTKIKGQRIRFGSLALFLLVIVGALVISKYVQPLPQFRPELSEALGWVSAVLVLAGLAIRWWAIIALGKFFTVDITLQEEHKLVTEGPYRLIRHPSYTGLLLILFGLGLGMQNYLSLMLFFLPPTLFLLFRINVEENALKQHFKCEYQAYSNKTDKLIPWVY